MERKVGKVSRKKLPAPQVRQTLTSMIRLVRGNPLILKNNTGTKDCSIDELKNKLPTHILNDPSGILGRRETLTKEEIPLIGRPSIAKNKNAIDKPKVEVFRKPNPAVATTKLSRPVLRRKSVSLDSIPKAKELTMLNCTATQSMESVNMSPIKFATSLTRTPNRANKLRNSTPMTMSQRKTPSLKELEQRLNIWLKKRNKRPSNLQNLKTSNCDNIFARDKSLNDEPLDKENNAAALNIETERDIINEFGQIPHDELIAALNDMKTIISKGYEKECEYLLNRIQKDYSEIDEIPEYWECRAALEQDSMNLHEAIECYKKAIIHGAEIENVNESLDKLFQKFGVINMTDSVGFTPNTKKKEQNTKVFCQQFKSSIIQFAVLQRKMKTEGENRLTSVVTPVRRSARLSHIRTPRLKVSSSLHDLDENEEMNFKNNTHLSVRYI